jgi:hypothetical protein
MLRARSQTGSRELASLMKRYTALRPFSEGLAAFAVLKAESNFFVRRSTDNLRWGYIDREGRVVIPTEFFDVGDFSEGMAQVNVGGEKKTSCGPPHNYGYIDKTGAFIIEPQFTMAAAFKNGRASVSVGQVEYVGRCLCCAPRFVGKHGHVSRNGEFVVEQTSEGEPLFPGDVEKQR